jgi:starvation-inducible DNA-binding protein
MSELDNLNIVSLTKFRFVGAVEPEQPEQPGNMALPAVLQQLLADVASFYHIVHEAHWNVTGTDFYQYHKFFDEIVEDVYNSIDPIAENIRKLGAKPAYRMSELFKQSKLPDNDIKTDNAVALASTLGDLNKTLINELQQVFDKANSDNEQGVANFIAERIDAHQKWQWFLEASAG